MQTSDVNGELLYSFQGAWFHDFVKFFRFTNSGTLSLTHMTVIAADSASFNDTSYSEANSVFISPNSKTIMIKLQVDVDCVGVCTLDGNAQISQLSILSHAHVVFPQSCKLISDSMHISANG